MTSHFDAFLHDGNSTIFATVIKIACVIVRIKTNFFLYILYFTSVVGVF
jgi:hypothetical protein